MWSLQKAYQFLCLVLFLLIFQANLSSSSSITQLCSLDEATALIQFKRSFSTSEIYSSSESCAAAGIKSYAKTDSWKEGTDCCAWDGVTCDNITGQVIGLDLSCSWLYGTIPSNSSLFCLPHLQKLNLAFNHFHHSNMPPNFGLLASLVYLNLSAANFAGQVPSQFSHLSKLVSLDLSWNRYQSLDNHALKGVVHNLAEVRQLFLDGIDMSSINPKVLMNLSSSSRTLGLESCDLQRNFPENVFLLPNLKLLSLRYNEDLIPNLPMLNRSNHLLLLDLSLVSSLSTASVASISNSQSLKYLYLSGAYFSEGLPNSMANLSSLVDLDVSDSFFSGGLPDSITNLLSLEDLDVSYSFFSGGLPDTIGNLISLKYLDLYSANLMGSIPRSLGNLWHLSYFDLSGNNFSGKIPSSLANLTELEFLQIPDNQLEGSIPDEIAAFPNLISLDLSSNLLDGMLPSWLFVASSLKYIYLSNNKFSGPMKEFQRKSLEVIELWNNKLQGPIPFSISQLVNLTTFYLSSNHLSGIVEFGSKSLQGLDLSNNKISGKIPKWMWDVGKDSLIYLNLSHNSLTEVEQLPWNVIVFLDLSSNLIKGDLPIPPLTTYVFSISNNKLSGKISPLICDVSSPGLLDLSHNNLKGSIPQCFEYLSGSLWMLNLQMDKLHGIIPPIFMDGCQLKNLNLNGNKLEGPLTRSIINCESLEVLDLGNNKINDTFSHWLRRLPNLQVLVLRSNQLHGSVHSNGSILFFSNIQIFDLWSNNFTGPLPVSYIEDFEAMINLKKDLSVRSYMGDQEDRYGIFYSYSLQIVMKGLNVEMVKVNTMLTSIDLSNNNFEGEIPEVIGKLNSLIGLNLSHNNLNGSIPISIGNLSSLEWLDLSSNKLTGMIPERLLDVPWLSFLNLSDNQLVGCIPGGKQFNTFENSSYEGNKGLRGFPLSKDCSKNEPPQSTQSNMPAEDGPKANIAFGWKVVLTGYGCGLVFGLVVGYVVFKTGKPKWLVALVEDGHHKRRKMSKIGNRRSGRRRI
ncbi:hypothetical protein PTKIN_Ptkin14bG0021300 [Pterospermum kingtungense]